MGEGVLCLHLCWRKVEKITLELGKLTSRRTTIPQNVNLEEILKFRIK